MYIILQVKYNTCILYYKSTETNQTRQINVNREHYKVMELWIIVDRLWIWSNVFK